MPRINRGRPTRWCSPGARSVSSSRSIRVLRPRHRHGQRPGARVRTVAKLQSAARLPHHAKRAVAAGCLQNAGGRGPRVGLDAPRPAHLAILLHEVQGADVEGEENPAAPRKKKGICRWGSSWIGRTSRRPAAAQPPQSTRCARVCRPDRARSRRLGEALLLRPPRCVSDLALPLARTLLGWGGKHKALSMARAAHHGGAWCGRRAQPLGAAAERALRSTR